MGEEGIDSDCQYCNKLVVGMNGILDKYGIVVL